MFQVLISLATAALQPLPPSLSFELARIGNAEEIESIAYAPDNRMQLDFRESVRIVFSPQKEGTFQFVQVMECKNVASDGLKWSCSEQPRWRIYRSSKIYIRASEQVNAWIAQDPQTALSPYLKLIDEVHALYPKGLSDAPLSAISIDPAGSEAIFYRYGSGCQTSIGIRSSFGKAGVSMHLDLLQERSICI